MPKHIISATLVAFGTSLPELVTAITAVRRGHGELAVGNIIGADILNVLFCCRCLSRGNTRWFASRWSVFPIFVPGYGVYSRCFPLWHFCVGQRAEASFWDCAGGDVAFGDAAQLCAVHRYALGRQCLRIREKTGSCW